MKIGCVREIRNDEFRVGLTPDNVKSYAGNVTCKNLAGSFDGVDYADILSLV